MSILRYARSILMTRDHIDFGERKAKGITARFAGIQTATLSDTVYTALRYYETHEAQVDHWMFDEVH